MRIMNQFELTITMLMSTSLLVRALDFVSDGMSLLNKLLFLVGVLLLLQFEFFGL